MPGQLTEYRALLEVETQQFVTGELLAKKPEAAELAQRPYRYVIENYPEEQVEQLQAVNNPEDPAAGHREVPFGRVVYIERDDFMEEPPKKFFRLAPGREVRLRYAGIIRCDEAVRLIDGKA